MMVIPIQQEGLSKDKGNIIQNFRDILKKVIERKQTSMAFYLPDDHVSGWKSSKIAKIIVNEYVTTQTLVRRFCIFSKGNAYTDVHTQLSGYLDSKADSTEQSTRDIGMI